MIHEEICTYEVCKLAKEKGFREKCIEHYYDDTKDLYRSSNPQCYNFGGNTSDAPTQSLLQRWLREEKGVVIEIPVMPTTCTNEMYEYKFYIFWNSDGHYMDAEYDDRIYTQYEHALEDALKYALENLV